MLSPRELEREAKIIAHQLFRQKAWIENRSKLTGGSPPVGEKDNWIIVSSKTQRKRKGRAVSAVLIKAMRDQCWLSSDPTGALRLSAAGLEKFIDPAMSHNKDHNLAAAHQDRQSRIIKDPQGITVSVQSNETESPLGWMRARKDKSGKPLLSPEQFAAGERIRQDFTMAQMSARVTSSWEFTNPIGQKVNSQAEGSLEVSERALAAKQRFFAAIDYLGPEMSGIIYEVCCMASGLEAAERQLGWPRRSAKLVLTIALAKLCEHYGLVRSDKKQDRPAAIQHWGRQGYRPCIPPAQPL